MRTLHRLLLILIWLGGCRALVEGKEDIGPKRMLNLDRALGGEAVERTVEVRGEGDPLVVYDGELAVLTRYFFVIHCEPMFGRRTSYFRCRTDDLLQTTPLPSRKI